MSRRTVPTSPSTTRDHCLAPGRARAGRAEDPGGGGYGRMFADLEPLRHGRDFMTREGLAAVDGHSPVFRGSPGPVPS